MLLWVATLAVLGVMVGCFASQDRAALLDRMALAVALVALVATIYTGATVLGLSICR